MKLPAISGPNSRALGSSRISSAPWFEIQFWEALFRFRCPTATWSYPRKHRGIFEVDHRPFVNSRSKRWYTGGIEGLSQRILAYRSGWSLGKRFYFSRPYATLMFDLIGLAVDPDAVAEYPDLFDEATAHAWLERVYRLNHASLARIGFLPASKKGFSELFFNDPEVAERVASEMKYSIETIDLQGVRAYRCQPFGNYLDFFVPFESDGVVQFSFHIEAKNPADEVARGSLLSEAVGIVDSIVSSLTMESRPV